jgi:predicted metal-binding membrane protein
LTAEPRFQRPQRPTPGTIRAPRGFAPLIALLIVAAWITLWLWAQSPYGRYLDHGSWTDIGAAGAICHALPGGRILLPVMLYVGGWLLMTAAMMLPTALPLLRRFERLVAARPERHVLVGLLITRYLAVWGGFGIAAHLLDTALHAAVRQSDWFATNGWLIGALVLGIAGGFQFTRLKYHCLDHCRTPFSFIAQHWHGRRPKRDAFVLGAHHGLFCVGCCWAIMLLMFAVGTGNVGWMLALGVVMAVEKNLAWGKLVSRPLGFALLIWAAAVTAANTL